MPQTFIPQTFIPQTTNSGKCKNTATPTTGPIKEVFNISNEVYDYEDAKQVCSIYDSRLATYDEIEESYNTGGEWCTYGWSEQQMVFYPTQKETYKKLQNNKLTANKCGRPGINGGYISNPNMKFGVNCYGVKPKPTDDEMARMKNSVETVFDNAKINYWKENADKYLNVTSFNKDKWSETECL